MRAFRDRDYFEDVNGFIFSVIGNVHPTDRVISYLKYVPSDIKGSIWRKGDVIYKRILKYYSASYVENTIHDFLKKHTPDYVVYDEVLGLEMIEVPHNSVSKHYIPEERIKEILLNPKDELEKLLADLVNIILSHTGISKGSCGVTGSILLKIHNVEKSDIDLTIYGIKNSRRVRHFLYEILNNSDLGFSRLYGDILDDYARRLSLIHPLTFEEAKRYYLEIWNRGLYKGRFFSIHPVLTEDEIPERYGDRIFRSMGLIKIKARIIDDTYSMFMPAIYYIDDVEVVSGPKVDDIIEICSYEGLYSDIAHKDDEIIAYGKLEKVLDKKRGKEYYRVLIGSFEAGGNDYLKVR